MPPQGNPRPDAAESDGLISWLETTIDRAAAAKPNPGRSPLHRLNRTEYGNAIRDLLDLDIDAAALLPADDEMRRIRQHRRRSESLAVTPGTVSGSVDQKSAAWRWAIPATTPISQLFQVPPDLAQEDHIEGLPLGTRGGILIHHNFPLDAEYDFSVALLQNIVGYVTGLEWPHQLEITVDGARVFLAPVGGEEDNKMSDANLGDRQGHAGCPSANESGS